MIRGSIAGYSRLKEEQLQRPSLSDVEEVVTC